MSALLAPDILTAALLLLAVGLAEPMLVYRLERWLESNRAWAWAVEQLVEPMLRAAAVGGFVLLAYPALFGVRSAPDLSALVAQGSLRLSALFNVLFVLSLALPLLPALRHRAALAVPVQGLVATAMVFGWFTDYLGATAASWWPGTLAAGAVVAMAWISHRLAAEAGAALGRWADARWHTSGLDHIVPNALELLAQAPVMIYYGLVLGRQVAI
ncbi:MAG: hypothetical protein ACU85V_00605 [Gammaproteobacteria bacterium]